MAAVTPAELNKSLTILLNDCLADTGFSKKRIGRLKRKAAECEQFFLLYFTRRRGLPGNLYALTATLAVSFPEVNRLTCEFSGEEREDAGGLFTGSKPFYTVVPGEPLLKYTYCSDEPLSRFAEMVSEDFRSFALPFYEKYDTLEKLWNCFSEELKGNKCDFHVSHSGKKPGEGRACCIAAVLCLLEKREELRQFLEKAEILSDEEKSRMTEYFSGSL